MAEFANTFSDALGPDLLIIEFMKIVFALSYFSCVVERVAQGPSLAVRAKNIKEHQAAHLRRQNARRFFLRRENIDFQSNAWPRMRSDLFDGIDALKPYVPNGDAARPALTFSKVGKRSSTHRRMGARKNVRPTQIFQRATSGPFIPITISTPRHPTART